MDSIRTRVYEILTAHFGPGAVTATTPPTTELLGDLDCESMDLIAIVVTCEGEFGLVIDDAAADTWRTIDDIVTYLEAHQAEMSEPR